MNEYLGSPSLGIASLATLLPPGWQIKYRDDSLAPADCPTDADLVAYSHNWSKYSDAKVVFRPVRMTPEELYAGYLRLWRGFYANRRTGFENMAVAERTIQF